jgi:hypothetical protein
MQLRIISSQHFSDNAISLYWWLRDVESWYIENFEKNVYHLKNGVRVNRVTISLLGRYYYFSSALRFRAIRCNIR